MNSIICMVDDKHLPLYRVMWVSELPHFCGHEDCEREGQYEIRLEQGESLWATHQEQAELIQALQQWQGGLNSDPDWS